jgi:hypothetical protein
LTIFISQPSICWGNAPQFTLNHPPRATFQPNLGLLKEFNTSQKSTNMVP